MSRNCNLELRLVPYSDPDHHHHHHHPIRPKSSSESPEQRKQKQQRLTIFYDGLVSVCDVTEIQARAILWLASREMEDKLRTPTPTGSSPSGPPSSNLPMSQISSPNTGLSMKRSLQRFLQKRKHRMQATSPYHH